MCQIIEAFGNERKAEGMAEGVDLAYEALTLLTSHTCNSAHDLVLKGIPESAAKKAIAFAGGMAAAN